jgi:transposase
MIARLTPTQKHKEARRIRAVRALSRGLSQSQVAAILGTSCASVSNWAMRFRTGGVAELKARPAGRPTRSRAPPRGLEAVRLAVGTRLPDTLGLGDALWTWRSVQALAFRTCKSEMSRWTVVRHVRDWGFVPPAANGAGNSERFRAGTAGRAAGRSVYEIACGELAPAGWMVRADNSVLWAFGRRGEAAFATYAAPLAAADIIDFLERLRRHAGMPVLVYGPSSLVARRELGGWSASRAREVLLQATTVGPVANSGAGQNHGERR